MSYKYKNNKFSHILSESLPLPKKFFIYIKNNACKKLLRVNINDKVLRGQPLVFGDDFNPPVHAPTSGWIENICFYSRSSNQYKKNIKIVIVSDYLDKWIRLKPIKNYKKYNCEKLIKIINQSGIVGLGGSEFSSGRKLMSSINKEVHTLIVNAVESEPYVTSDQCLVSNYIYDILEGCRIVCWISKIKIVLIAIQEDKIELISKINSVIKKQPLFKLCIIKKKYPGGSSKILIKSLTGKEIPYGKHAVDIGYLIFNVATIYAIKQSIINGHPLTERIITILGSDKFSSGNFWIRIGTPIKYFINNEKIKKYFDTFVFFGGPFMGKKIYNLNYSILKKTNCIWINLKKEKIENKIQYSCIRCGYCSNVCPVNLLPQQLYWYSKNNHHKETKKHHVMDCIECKICEKVCPSYIPLVSYFKKEKHKLQKINLERYRKKISFIRFKEREKRLLHQKKIIDFFDKKITFKNEKKVNLIRIKEKVQEDMRKKMVQEAIDRIKSKQ